MVSIVDDFKDIASRMKGELKVKTKQEIINGVCRPVAKTCMSCMGSGTDRHSYHGLSCPHCNGTGVIS